MCVPQPAPSNEDEIMHSMYKFIDELFNIVRPRKLIYIAIGMFKIIVRERKKET